MQLQFEQREDWRSWLERHHAEVTEVWLVFPKKHTGRATVSYEDAVEEALCFGWIDSLIKRIDDDRYARKFTPRTNTRRWSASNLRRMERLKAAGLMTPAGLAKIAPDVRAEAPPAGTDGEPPAFVREALAANAAAGAFFAGLAPSHRRRIVGWICAAKREGTRRRRLAEALDLLARGRTLGMK